MYLSPADPTPYVLLRHAIFARHLSSMANYFMTGKDEKTSEAKTKNQKEHRRAQVRKAQM
jgi:hypothetical protein